MGVEILLLNTNSPNILQLETEDADQGLLQFSQFTQVQSSGQTGPVYSKVKLKIYRLLAEVQTKVKKSV